MTASGRSGLLLELGVTPYDPAHALQLALVDLRQRDAIPDTLLLLEHEPVITLGRRGEVGHILADRVDLDALGVQVRRVERGGDVTYHGPGQLVGYPIFSLAALGLGISDYMHRLEQVAIDLCADYGLGARRRDKLIGVWVGMNKIAAFGVRVRKGVTFHGLALNVAPNMRHWEMIVPCGITDGGVTSLAQELGQPPSMAEARERLVVRFQQAFSIWLEPVTLEQLASAHHLDITGLHGSGPVD